MVGTAWSDHGEGIVALASLIEEVVGGDLPIGLETHDGDRAGPDSPPATLVVRRDEALVRMATRPGELGFVRAYVAGDIDIEGDIYAMIEFAVDHPELNFKLTALPTLLREAGRRALRRLPPPPEEVRLSGWVHSRSRDRQAISHHYDVSNDFYAMVIGPSLTYSCAVFESPDDSLEQAQANKHDLICRKLGLSPGMRLLDVGCGWGSMLIHAASHYGVRGVGVTISAEQEELARKRVAEAGLGELVEIRLQDYRDIVDGPFDAISSVGMFEHVGRTRMESYMRRLYALLRPGGRLLNHAISRPGHPQPDSMRGHTVAMGRRLLTATGSRLGSKIDSPFMQRYVFPDGELHEVGVVVSMLQDVGFEVRHVESIREHYAKTLRNWVANLEANWDDAVAEVGEGRARVWRLYMAASAVGFERNNIQVHQVLAVRTEGGVADVPLRPWF
jgi:cyclopropane-fatty-acyl-phospholipid synthase